MKRGTHLAFIFILFFLVLFGGAFAYHYLENWSFLDSFYFVVMTLTTIGYGDVVPHTHNGKLFTVFFAFFGVALTLYILTTVGASMFSRHVDKRVTQIKKDVKKKEEIEEDIAENIEATRKKSVKNKVKKRKKK